ncbi:restriction endonuclease subunit S [Polaribacter vadi]|uniref:restriction endonuclease subunit S n=1 Tax=Polaribacter TaxID=52959 RepID=UPI001C09B78A|nr:MULTISPECIES: restriction endonuclease subunit S [Polaribacter]MBU3011143.1 restriction endonuclease subunit S [Polaribacter vadi]MDO6740957.1 restriction endonuclease subunit S [Polaribacter sp. 1_MG-2023]
MQKEKRLIPELRFVGFEKEWQNKFFSEMLLSSRLGGNYSNSEIPNDYPLIKMGNLGRGSIKLDKLEYIDEKEELKSEDLIKEGDLFFNTRNTLDLVGKVAIWRNELPKAYYNSNLMYIKFENNYFMNYSLNSFQGIKKLRRIATGTTSVAAIYSKDLFKLKFNIPSLEEQQKIANFLTTIDTQIQTLEKKKSLLEQYKKGVMQKIFKQEFRFKMEDGSLFPEWVKLKLSDFLITTLREVDKPNNNYLAIGIRSHCKGTFQKPNSDPSKNSMKKLFVVQENDLIVNITFAWEGAIAIVKKEDEGAHVSHRFPTYTFNRDLVIHEFFKYVIIQKKFRNILDLISPGGAGRNRVMSKKEFVKIKWSIPCVEEQTKIANFLSAIDENIALVNTKIEHTKAYKKGLLQQMFV